MRFHNPDRIERGQWYVAIYPAGNESPETRVFGTRKDAEVKAHFMMDVRQTKKTGGVDDRQAGLARKAGAPASYVDHWRKFIANWPHHESDATLANEAQFLVDWADELR